MKLTEPSEELMELMETNANQDEIWNEMEKIEDRFCLVKDKKTTYGYIVMTTLCEEDKTVKEVAESIKKIIG